MELIIKEAAVDLLAWLGVAEAEVRVKRDGSANDPVQHFDIAIACDSAPLLIGRRGETLQSFQHFLKLLVLKKLESELAGEERAPRIALTVDIDGYRERQVEELLALAERRATQVQESGSSIKLPPMTSFLRRAVHLYIAERYPELTTESTGYGARKVLTIQKKC